MSHNFWQLPNQSHSFIFIIQGSLAPPNFPAHLRPSGSPKPWPSFKCATVSISMVSSRREPRISEASHFTRAPLDYIICIDILYIYIYMYYMYTYIYIYIYILYIYIHIWSILEYPSSQRLTQRTSNLFVAKSQCSRLKSQLFNLLSRVQWWKIPSFGWWTNLNMSKSIQIGWFTYS